LEEPHRAVRSTRGQGGHAFQLENAIKANPSRTVNKKAAYSNVPESIPENAMAPFKRPKGGDKIG
jgi:hypothetical protein